MRFDLDHDWQGNMATPRAKMGERAKTQLLIVLCAIWLCMGLIGHTPWKPFESQSMSIVKSIIEGQQWLTPLAASQSQLQNPPLYYWVAAIFATILSPIVAIHDGARFSSGIWMLITLLMVGMTGRELWDKGIGRQTTFVFIGCLGLIISAHTTLPAVSSLTGLATAFYSLALAKRRPYRSALFLGLGLGVSFLSTGLLPALIIFSTCILLPIFFSNWRTKQFLVTLLIALLIASPLLFIWPALSFYYAPNLFLSWWNSHFHQLNNFHHLYFLKTLIWYAWPALPLAVWGLWRFRTQLLNKTRFQLILVFFFVALFFIGFGNDNQVFALPLLIPLTALAGGSIETLKRGAASALNWFGLMLFGLMCFLIWLGWSAMFTDWPAKLKERLIFLSGMSQLNFNLFAFVLATFVTLIWLFAIFRSQHSNRSTATNWAIGVSCIWTLLMTLWLPLIESARSYQPVFTDFKNSLPAHFACINSHHLGDAQIDFLHYYANMKTQRIELGAPLNCDLYLIQDEKGREVAQLGEEWKLIWQGKRVSERKESFRLFLRIQ